MPVIGSSQNVSLKAEKWKSVEQQFDKSPVDTSYMGWIWGELLLLPFRQLDWLDWGWGGGGGGGGKWGESKLFHCHLSYTIQRQVELFLPHPHLV